MPVCNHGVQLCFQVDIMGRQYSDTNLCWREEDKMGGTRDTYGENEKYASNFSLKTWMED
jgi:hypothetical protein